MWTKFLTGLITVNCNDLLSVQWKNLIDLEPILGEKFYPFVRRPGRYCGGELNSIEPDEKAFQVALAFPDLYEIGFSYLGFQILYHLLNRIEGVSCQRVFAPAKDAEEVLRREKIP